MVMNPPPEGVRFFYEIGRYAHSLGQVDDELGVKLHNYNAKWELFLQGYKLGCDQTFEHLIDKDEAVIPEYVNEEYFIAMPLHEKFIYMYRRMHDT